MYVAIGINIVLMLLHLVTWVQERRRAWKCIRTCECVSRCFPLHVSRKPLNGTSDLQNTKMYLDFVLATLTLTVLLHVYFVVWAKMPWPRPEPLKQQLQMLELVDWQLQACISQKISPNVSPWSRPRTQMRRRGRRKSAWFTLFTHVHVLNYSKGHVAELGACTIYNNEQFTWIV